MAWEAKREHKCKKQKEQTEKQPETDADPATVKLKGLTWTLEAHDVMQPYRDEYCPSSGGSEAVKWLCKRS